MDRTTRIVLDVSYDGTNFVGWQRQPEGRSVQGTIEDALGRLCGDRPVNVVGSGRTDAGVHARGQIAHADVVTRYVPRELLYKLNRMLPTDVSVNRVGEAPDDFHARYDAVERTYRYSVHTVPDPFRSRYSWLVPELPDLDRMNREASALLGDHDCTTFSKTNSDASDNPRCTIVRAQWHGDDWNAQFEISANRFLYGMVRLIVGTLVKIGSGTNQIEDVQTLLSRRERSVGHLSAPPHGLTLERVRYGCDPFS